MEAMRLNQQMLQENQNKVNQMRRQRDDEHAKIQEAIYLSKREEAKQMQNKQRKHIIYSQVNQDNVNKSAMIK